MPHATATIDAISRTRSSWRSIAAREGQVGQHRDRRQQRDREPRRRLRAPHQRREDPFVAALRDPQQHPEGDPLRCQRQHDHDGEDQRRDQPVAVCGRPQRREVRHPSRPGSARSKSSGCSLTSGLASFPRSGTCVSSVGRPPSASLISRARSITAGGSPAIRATSIPNERELEPGRTRCEKTGAPPRRRALDRGDVEVRDRRPVLGRARRARGNASRTATMRRPCVSRSSRILADRLRDREAVDRAGAAPDFVDQQQAAAGRAAQDRRRLRHLDVERRLAGREVVAGADAREDAVDDPERSPPWPGRTSRSAPGSTSSAACRKYVDLPPMFGPVKTMKRAAVRAEVEIVRDEGGAEQRLDDRMAAVVDVDRRRSSMNVGRT